MRVPPLVERAVALAVESGCERSCTPEEGALLHVLSGRRGVVRAGEIGTGLGVGAAWIVSALPPGTAFVSAEVSRTRAAAAAALFVDDPDVRILAGAWRDVLPPQAPFDLLRVGARDARNDADAVLGLMAPGGTVLVGGFSGEAREPDPRRDAWLRHPGLAAVEIRVSPARSAVVALRV